MGEHREVKRKLKHCIAELRTEEPAAAVLTREQSRLCLPLSVSAPATLTFAATSPALCVAALRANLLRDGKVLSCAILASCRFAALAPHMHLCLMPHFPRRESSWCMFTVRCVVLHQGLLRDNCLAYRWSQTLIPDPVVTMI